MSWVEAVLAGVAVLLVINLLAAFAAVARARHTAGWLLVVLLTGTTGAAVAALLAALSENPGRFLDVALILAGFAALTAAVRVAAGRRPATDAAQR